MDLDKALERGLRIMVLDYLKRRANNAVYSKWDRGGYGEVPLPRYPYTLDDENSDEVKSIIVQLEQELLKG